LRVSSESASVDRRFRPPRPPDGEPGPLRIVFPLGEFGLDLGPMSRFFKNPFAEKIGENIGVFFSNYCQFLKKMIITLVF
jgi:hypothetical protein